MYPALLRDVADVHVFGADAAAVDAAQALQYLAQRHARAAHQRTGVERGIEIGVVEVVIGRIQLGDLRFRMAIERIEIGDAHTEETVRIDQLQHGCLLAVTVCVQCRLGLGCRNGSEIALYRAMWDIRRPATRIQSFEVSAPLGRDAGGVAQEVFVQPLDEHIVAAEQHRAVLHQLQEIHRLVQRFPIATKSRFVAPRYS